MPTRLRRGVLRRRILECLIAAQNQLVPTGQLLQHAYGDKAPANGRNSIANCIMILRLMGCRIEGVGCGAGFKGYRLRGGGVQLLQRS